MYLPTPPEALACLIVSPVPMLGLLPVIQAQIARRKPEKSYTSQSLVVHRPSLDEILLSILAFLPPPGLPDW